MIEYSLVPNETGECEGGKNWWIEAERIGWQVAKHYRRIYANLRTHHILLGMLVAMTAWMAVLRSMLFSSIPTSEPLDDVVLENVNEIRPPSFIFILKEGHGLGSALLNLYATAALLKETQNRSLAVSENFFNYKPDDEPDKGVLTGWFTPQFPVIDTREDFDTLIIPYATRLNGGKYTRTRAPSGCSSWTDKDADVTFACSKNYRDAFHQYYRTESDPNALYQPLVEIMCPNMQFNAKAQHSFKDLGREFGFPDFDDRIGTTVAFHVRRTDKLESESRLYHGEEYVKRLIKVTPPDTVFDNCFVATDDARAIGEIRDSLKKHNVKCELHSFAQEETVPRSNTLQFLAEMNYLIKSTYFVGTFNSNVGAMVAVLRACDHTRPSANYSNSYDVEGSTWYIR